MLSLLNTVLRYRRLVFGLPAVAAAVALLFVLMEPERYVADTTFMPQIAESRGSSWNGLATQLGLNSGAPTGESVQFYVGLLTSRELLRDAAATEYWISAGGDSAKLRSGTLAELYAVGSSRTPEARVRTAMAMLKQDISVTVDSRTGLVRLETTARWPELAVQINRRLLSLLNEFNIESRQSRAKAQREFIEGRLRDVGQELRAAEADMERFLARNRRYQESPELTFEAARLRRTMELRQQVHSSLVQSYESARIEEVRDIPVITIVDGPEGSVRQANSRPFLLVWLALILGLVLALAISFTREHLSLQRVHQPDEYARFVELTRATVTDLVPTALRQRAGSSASNGANAADQTAHSPPQSGESQR